MSAGRKPRRCGYRLRTFVKRRRLSPTGAAEMPIGELGLKRSRSLAGSRSSGVRARFGPVNAIPSFVVHYNGITATRRPPQKRNNRKGGRSGLRPPFPALFQSASRVRSSADAFRVHPPRAARWCHVNRVRAWLGRLAHVGAKSIIIQPLVLDVAQQNALVELLLAALRGDLALLVGDLVQVGERELALLVGLALAGVEGGVAGLH